MEIWKLKKNAQKLKFKIFPSIFFCKFFFFSWNFIHFSSLMINFLYKIQIYKFLAKIWTVNVNSIICMKCCICSKNKEGSNEQAKDNYLSRHFRLFQVKQKSKQNKYNNSYNSGLSYISNNNNRDKPCCQEQNQNLSTKDNTSY